MRLAVLLAAASLALASSSADQQPPVAAPPPANAPLTVPEYEAMADELCRCLDMTCAEGERQNMYAEATQRPAAEPDRPALAATYDRAMGCYAMLMR